MTTHTFTVTPAWIEDTVGGRTIGRLAREVFAEQTFTVANGDLLDVALVLPPTSDLSARIVHAAVGFGDGAGRPGMLRVDRGDYPSAVNVVLGVEFANDVHPIAAATSAGGTWHPPASMWTSTGAAGFVEESGLLRFPAAGSIVVSVLLGIEQYPDTAASTARQEAAVVAMRAERAAVAAQRAVTGLP